MEPNVEEKQESKMDKEQLERLLITSGLKQSDIDKLREQRWDDISEEAKELLQNLEITEEAIKEVFLVKSKEEIKNTVLKKREEESKNIYKEMKKRSSVTLVPREEMEKFLRERSLSESLIRTLLKVGFTDEFARLLKAMGFIDDDLTVLQNLWDLEEEKNEKDETDSFISLPSSSDEYLSSDGLYLKSFLSKPLACALREIVAKKPFDPIEYLGHWLLNYKICEERDKRRRELELELMIERERLRPQEEETPMPIEHEEEEEEYVEDWNFLDYE